MLDLNIQTEFDNLTYEELKNTCLNCQNCKLSENRKNVVFGVGNVPCNVMVIGEGPGEQEDLSGVPFIGKAGQLLTKIFESVKINREDDIYITNIVKCRPPQNRNPEKEEVNVCKSYLLRQINLVKPKIIIVLGSPALKTILGETLSITKERGKWFKKETNYMEDFLYIIPMFHPSYLLRNDSREKESPKWLTWQDMKELKSAMDFYAVFNK
jgi:uracil-DNA glycosylase